ncbi:MAG: RNA-binding protein [Pelagerythrobacter marensis]|nr:MAG: RNA-binding protein [Pelagerythrobacter marensis]
MRIDRALCLLRFVKTRSQAQALIASGHLRRNGRRVLRASEPVCAGDVLTLPLGARVRVIALDTLPSRRGPPAEARSHYRELDPGGQSALAAGQTPASPRDTVP